MRIGLDGIPLCEIKTGVGHYTFELAQALARANAEDEFELISPSPYLSAPGDEAQVWPPNLRAVQAKLNPLSRRQWWSVGLPLYARRASLDLFHGTNYDVPLWHRCPTVLTIHDLSLLLYAETHEDHLVRRGRRRLPMMARAADKIITATESVKREICEHLGVKPDKVVVTPYAPRRSFRRMTTAETIQVRRRLGVEEEFILYVGTVEPRKNLLTLVRAFDELLRATALRPQLVIAGKEGWLTNELFSYLKNSEQRERVRFTGYVTDEDLSALYSSCRVFVYPSLYEGFGLPPLEAMACGAPVVASRIETLSETLGSAARLVSPNSFRELAEAISDVLTDSAEREHLASAGRLHAEKFTWEKTASATFDVYREVVGKG